MRHTMVITLTLALVAGPLSADPARGADGRSALTDPARGALGLPANVVYGRIDDVGAGYVVISGERFATADRVTVQDKLGQMEPGGTGLLKPPVEVEATLEGDVVVQIRLFDLPR